MCRSHKSYNIIIVQYYRVHNDCSKVKVITSENWEQHSYYTSSYCIRPLLQQYTTMQLTHPIFDKLRNTIYVYITADIYNYVACISFNSRTKTWNFLYYSDSISMHIYVRHMGPFMNGTASCVHWSREIINSVHDKYKYIAQLRVYLLIKVKVKSKRNTNQKPNNGWYQTKLCIKIPILALRSQQVISAVRKIIFISFCLRLKFEHDNYLIPISNILLVNRSSIEEWS